MSPAEVVAKARREAEECENAWGDIEGPAPTPCGYEILKGLHNDGHGRQVGTLDEDGHLDAHASRAIEADRAAVAREAFRAGISAAGGLPPKARPGTIWGDSEAACVERLAREGAP